MWKKNNDIENNAEKGKERNYIFISIRFVFFNRIFLNI